MNLPLLKQELMGWIQFLPIIEEYLLVMNAFHKAMKCPKQKRAQLWGLLATLQKGPDTATASPQTHMYVRINPQHIFFFL